MKGGAALEAIGRVTTVAFDKTGTLTEGRPHVTDVIALGGSAEETLRLAAAVEAASSHPIGTAILAEAGRRALSVPGVVNASAIGGKAVTGDGGAYRYLVESIRKFPPPELFAEMISAHLAMTLVKVDLEAQLQSARCHEALS